MSVLKIKEMYNPYLKQVSIHSRFSKLICLEEKKKKVTDQLLLLLSNGCTVKDTGILKILSGCKS